MPSGNHRRWQKKQRIRIYANASEANSMKLSWRPLPVREFVSSMILDLMNSKHLAMILFTIELWVEPSRSPYTELSKLIIHAGCTGLHVKVPRKYPCIMVFPVSMGFFPHIFFRFPCDCPSVMPFFPVFSRSLYQSPSFACLSCHNFFCATMDTTMPLKRKLLL